MVLSRLRTGTRQHVIALALPAIAATLSGFQVVKQFGEDFGATSGRRIGKAETTQGEVLKRSSRSFRWYNVAASEDLVEKSSIKTAEDSGVSLKFRDGSTLKLGPQALVVLGSASDGVPKLKVVRGEVAFQTKAKMLIEAGGKTLETSEAGNAAGRVAVTHGAATTSITEGTAAMKIPDAAPMAMAAGSMAMIDVEGGLTAKGLPKPAPPPTVDPAPPTSAPNVAPPAPAAPPAAAPSAAGKKAAATKSGDFEVFPYEVKGSTKLTTRLTNAQSLKTLKIELSWKPVEGAKEYAVEFLNSKKRPVSRKVTTDPSLLLEIKKTSEFERAYRIIAKREGDNREYRSEDLKYTIELAAPIPVNPAEGEKWTGGIMTWESTMLTDSYEIQLARDPAFSKPDTTESKFNFTKVGPKDKGAHYWRVRANVGGRQSPWSEARKFIQK